MTAYLSVVNASMMAFIIGLTVTALLKISFKLWHLELPGVDECNEEGGIDLDP